MHVSAILAATLLLDSGEALSEMSSSMPMPPPAKESVAPATHRRP